jgi:peptidoglycan hydrolase-like protein with peptidoglycan-binding domain
MAPKPTLKNPIRLDLLPHPNVTWVQQQLVRGGYLEEADIDGAVGLKTVAAFSAWKQDQGIGTHGMIEPSSIELLAEIEKPDSDRKHKSITEGK